MSYFMKFIGDLHVHSKFSRATARNLDLENLYIAAQLKGITVVGTGDFTFPGWFEEINEKLEPAEPGLFRLKNSIAVECDKRVPAACRNDVRFILTTEISNIYKKEEKTRKNHNLVLAPDLDIVRRFNTRLDQIGNIKSDGRPILGLDARNLLEILLETSEDAFLIPAHIWTPWFSVLGSKSGFDSINECFGDLTSHIFAVETGLSSDPAMNWRVSSLDGMTLVSNSDAHSPGNLGREANIFNTNLSFDGIKSALNSGHPDHFLGTLEFYPEEGKYHLDGHRNCDVCLWPGETRSYEGVCPACAKPLTIGVLYRVEELADREAGQKPDKTHPFHSLIPLTDILSEILRVGPKSKKVGQAYHNAISTLGSELDILQNMEPDQIDRAGIPLLGEAIQRMRDNRVDISPGYDGEYGKIRIFSDSERTSLLGQLSLFVMPGSNGVDKDAKFETSKNRNKRDKGKAHTKSTQKMPTMDETTASPQIDDTQQLNPEQRKAVLHPDGHLLIVAGPGTGKTHTLTCRIAHLLTQKKVSPESILAVTFTNKAAREMEERLASLTGEDNPLPLVATFHSLCFKILSELNPQKPPVIIDDVDRSSLMRDAVNFVEKTGIQVSFKLRDLLKRIVNIKQQILDPDEIIQKDTYAKENGIISLVYRVYQNLLKYQGLYDYEDLIFKVVRLLETDPQILTSYRDRFKHVFVDEYQDLNQGQYRIIRALVAADDVGNNLCAIGDPDQSIYGFRGSEVHFFKQFVVDYPTCAVINLTRNYRSTKTILDASFQVINEDQSRSTETRVFSEIDGTKTISTLELGNENAEAEAISRIIEDLVGGTGFHSIDTRRVKDANLSHALSYADFAVLYRTHLQSRVLSEAFDRSGVPYQVASRENLFMQPGLPELLSYLKVVEGTAGYSDHEKVIGRSLAGFGKKTMGAFKEWCFQNKFSLGEGLIKARRFPIPALGTTRQQMLNDFSQQIKNLKYELAGQPVAAKLAYLIQQTGVSEVIKKDVKSEDALKMLLERAKEFGTNTVDFLATAALNKDTDMYEPRAEKVSLMTMHAAKGLEFPVVFIAGCENDFMPYKRSDEDTVDMAEERRLFYVAMTRAKERLYLTHAKKRRTYGKYVSRNPSPFMADIESRLKSDDKPLLKKKKKDKPKQEQLKLF